LVKIPFNSNVEFSMLP